MSRIGKKSIPLPQGVSVQVSDAEVRVKGPKGELSRPRLPLIEVEVEGAVVQVRAAEESRRANSFHGLCRTLINNMVVGVSQGFTRQLDLVGVGYRAELQGREINLSLGYSHPVLFPLPEGIEAEVDRTKIILKGIDKELLGQTAAKLRALRPPEPYKGKGVKYAEEVVRRKAGKAGARA